MNAHQRRIPCHFAYQKSDRSLSPSSAVANLQPESDGLNDPPFGGQLRRGNSSKGFGLGSWFHDGVSRHFPISLLDQSGGVTQVLGNTLLFEHKLQLLSLACTNSHLLALRTELSVPSRDGVGTGWQIL